MTKAEKAAKAKIEAHPAFKEMWWEDDGCFVDEETGSQYDKAGNKILGLWVSLKDGYSFEDCSCIHRANYVEALQDLESVEKD